MATTSSALKSSTRSAGRICAEVPDPETAQRWLKETTAAVRSYAVWIYYLGNFMAAAGFCCVFGGTVRDWLWAGLSGLTIGFVTRCMDRLEVNPFFSTIAASFLMALPAYVAAGLGWLDCVAVVIIGALMLLVPGLLITNSMRDIIYGDTSSGRQPHRAGAAPRRLPSRSARRRRGMLRPRSAAMRRRPQR